MTVAHSGRGWRLAPSLVALEAEADRLAPRRNRASDGSIGDAAHRSRGSRSDHNIDGGWVHALDLTHDPRGGFDAHAHARAIAQRGDPRVKYIITNRRIWQPGIGWSGYGGENPHTHHAHFSVLHTNDARGDLRPWLTSTGAPIPAVPSPPRPHMEADVFLIVEGLGFYACVPGLRPIFLSKADFEAAQRRSPNVPTMTLGGGQPTIDAARAAGL